MEEWNYGIMGEKITGGFPPLKLYFPIFHYSNIPLFQFFIPLFQFFLRR
jgi:hypothetical protein